jgi:hypothetical protein
LGGLGPTSQIKSRKRAADDGIAFEHTPNISGLANLDAHENEPPARTIGGISITRGID